MTKTKKKSEAKGESIPQVSKMYRVERGLAILDIIEDQNTKHSKVTNPSKFNFTGTSCESNQ